MTGTPYLIRPLENEDYSDWHAIMTCPSVLRQTLQLRSLTPRSACLRQWSMGAWWGRVGCRS
jgi:hypothetical protein